MKKLLAVFAAVSALVLTGCDGAQTYDGYVHAECDPATQSADGKVKNCSVTEKPLPTETVSVPGPTTTVTVPGPTTTVTTTVTPPATTPPATTPPATTAPATNERRYTAYVTGYSYYDNDPPNSTSIAYESVVPSRTGAGGTGTYTNPTTIAVPERLPDGQVHAPGDRFYIPNLQKYFIVEDLCAESHANNYTDCTSHDVWVDGRPYGNTTANNCMNRLTGDFLVIKNPAANYRVATPGTITANCTTYGNTVRTQ